ncbi:MAG TPA: type IV pilin N-terminal domain-containing protein [Methanolinea sp.]|nr:type IV pilin N-terminal domain-containing protein [Methanolinea sp.]HQK54971.1 type IV pilin N-terminal domain-containing protein [Methanolinea sp.]
MSFPPPRDSAVSEILGALLLVAVISLAVSIVGVTIISNIETSQVPAVSFVITNQSQNISVFHTGGDSLPAGSYRIYVNDVDQTASFSPDPGITEFKAGTVLHSNGQFLPPGQGPRNAMVIYRGPDGKDVVLIQKFFS